MVQSFSPLPKPLHAAAVNTAQFEQNALVKPTGFREYDARWLFEKEINLQGIHYVGLGMATQFRRHGIPARFVVGHDFRSYSSAIKMALTTGLMAGGAEVFDIGLAMSPMAYFAQFDLDVEGVAMVTASHNDNGWTGIKMGMGRPLTFGKEEMEELKAIVLNADFDAPLQGGSYHLITDMPARYLADLANRKKLDRKLKVICACGNGTAGVFAPQALRTLGCEVVELNCDLDYTFPNHNPNPEDMAMLHAVRDAVLEHGADVGLAFDGDGDRCGVVDNTGDEIFADKIGVILARDLSTQYPGSSFVVDVKSTGLFQTDPVLKANNATTTYWKTGHSYIKRFCHENGTLAGFEKSGHFFFNTPIGRGYDDGLVTAFAVCDALGRNPGKTMADLKNELSQTWQSPTMSPHCGDEVKYGVVDRAIAHFKGLADSGQVIAGQKVTEVITINGIPIVLEDGTWGLVRASSNKPELVIVVESPVSEANMRSIFAEIDGFLATQSEVGAYNQKI